MDDSRLLRYSRQILLPQIDIGGQEVLLNAQVLIIGAGGLGSAAALYLAAAGVGKLSIADPDPVEPSNLQRQVVYTADDIGVLKVNACKQRLTALNPDITVAEIPEKLAGEALLAEVARSDIVLDCTDNLQSRFAINKACVKILKPLVSAAAIRWEGQITVIHAGLAESPCYHCFHDENTQLSENCSENGILGPVVGVLGNMQAIEAIKLLTRTGELLVGRVLLFDAFSMQVQVMQLPKNPNCPVCGNSIKNLRN